MKLTIEKLVYGGDGLARGPAGDAGRGKAVFVPFVLAGEHVEASAVEEKAGFIRARVEKLLQPSPQRAEPRCPYFSQCGGCQYQHAEYEHQVEIKRHILQETLRRLGGIEAPPIVAHPSPPYQYRNRTRMQVRTGKNFALGYFRAGSHTLLPVEHCPISSPLINRAVAAIWDLGRRNRVSQALTEVEFFANATDAQLLLELTLSAQFRPGPKHVSLVDFVTELRAGLPEVIGVSAFRATPKGAIREDVPEELRPAFGADELVYDAGGCEYHVSAGSFFQTNRYLTGDMVEIVTGGCDGAAALDLYAGTGLFSLPLSQKFRQVIAVEPDHFSFHDLRRNTPSNVKASRETTEQFLERCSNELAGEFDLIVVDPPRAGLGESTARSVAALQSSRVTYVSCDPATLARDLKTLTEQGFRLEQLHLLDVFPQTFHIESIAQLAR